MAEPTSRRFRTFIQGLDERMQGGIPEGHIVLVSGVSGSMKSSIAFSMLYNAVLHEGTSGVYLTLEQGKESLAKHMAGMGMDVDDPRVRNRIAVIDLADLRVQLDKQHMTDKIDWMGQLLRQLQKYRDTIGFELLIFDSIGAFFQLTRTEKERARDEIFRVFEAVRRMGLTSFFVCEMMGETKNQYGEFGVEDYLSDGVISLAMERNGDSFTRKLAVIKMRHTEHKLGYSGFKWDPDEKRFSVS